MAAGFTQAFKKTHLTIATGAFRSKMRNKIPVKKMDET